MKLLRVFKPFSIAKGLHNLYILFRIRRKKIMALKEVEEREVSKEEEETFDDSVFEGLDALSDD